MKIKCTFHIAIAFILIQLTDEFSIAFAYGICEKNPYVRILYVTFAILSLLTMIYLYTKYIIRIQMQDLFLGMPLPKKKWCQADHEVLRRAQLCRNFGHLRAEEEQHQRREDTAKGRCIKCNFQRRLSAAHFGQRIAVQHSSRRVGRTRRVDKDSRYRSTIATCAVNAQQEHHAGNRTHGISDRQE